MVERPNDESRGASRSEPGAGADPSGAPQLPAAGLGPRVTAVFTAAEQAADHIVKMAREEVVDLRSRVEADLEAFRRERRAAAEEEAREIVSAARSEAESIRREASITAAAIEEVARTREQWVTDGIRLLTERAEWGRRGLEEVLERLQPFVEHPPEEWPELPREPLPSLSDAAPPAPAADEAAAAAPPSAFAANGEAAEESSEPAREPVPSLSDAAPPAPAAESAAETSTKPDEDEDWRSWRRSADD